MKNQLGLFIRQRRKQLNITQVKLAKILGLDSAQFISNIERGSSSFPKSKLKRLSKALMIDRSTLRIILLTEADEKICKILNLEK